MRHRARLRANKVNSFMRNQSGVVLIMFALVSVLQLAWFSYQGRDESAQRSRIAKCQTDYNFQVASTVELRSQFADQDRESLVRFIRTVANSKSRQQSRDALNDYLETQKRLETERKEHPIPKLPVGRCR